MIPNPVLVWLSDNHFGDVVSKQPVDGGCINLGQIILTESGKSFFLKLNSSSPTDMFAREFEGLAAIRKVRGPKVPEPYIHGNNFLLMEDLKSKSRRGDYWSTFGIQLAELHNNTSVKFGFFKDNYIGSTSQPNPWVEDGNDFFGEYRLLYMAGLARDRRLLNEQGYKQVNKLVGRLSELIPEQKPSLIHGDLWSGNATSDSNGAPAIIDPAVHYGWPEAELAMTSLFGPFPHVFYKAYEEVRPLEPGYDSRFPIYNLYHLLNHVVLFGSGYLEQVLNILKNYE